MKLETDVLSACWFLAGPTACGKSAVACELADMLGAEILSLDSMALYRGMDIGTAKPDAGARARVPHHLVDILDPHEEYSLADYVRAAARAAGDVARRGRVPLFVGGTGLYLRGVLRGVFQGPPADPALRRALEETAAAEGNAAVHARLASIDPALAARLVPGDLRRVIRGIEVYEQTKTPLSAQQTHGPLPETERPRVLWLHPPRGWLHDRINSRVEDMFRAGLVAEVEGLLARDRPLGNTARQALGYREVIDGLAAQVPLTETITLIQARTRQFAKRQHTWFRNLAECRAVEMTGAETPRELAERVLEAGLRLET
ncbi:MAG: tRNA (adenosine(37)-N6)-dimethylallyltransferase MiaA [Planctomycetia bacterium]|nr:tRNA (adenosine(37)-N6)-dimethylallyltransferase MiaA [Planctomycetia bacterium]